MPTTYEATLASFGDLEMLLSLGNTAGLADRSGNERDGTAAGGITIGGVSPGPLAVGDDGATDFDGTNDRITTTYGTRRNFMLNPWPEIDLADWWYTAQLTVTRDTSFARPGRAASVRLDGSTNADLFAYQRSNDPDVLAAFGGVKVTASAWVYKPAGAVTRSDRTIFLLDRSAVDSTWLGDLGPSLSSLPDDEWTRVSVTRQMRDPIDFMSVRFQGPINGVPLYWSDVLIEISDEMGSYFPTPDQLTSGEAGWTGTAYQSASDLGCFANGTSRTFMGWAYRDAALDLDTLFSSDASLLSNAWPSLRVTPSNHVTWRTQNSGPVVQWSSAWPGTGQWVHWALTYNESTDEQALYIDGALVSSQTVVNSYAAGAGSFQVGRASASNVDPYDGKMAWVSVHEHALTENQILQSYRVGRALVQRIGVTQEFPALRETIIATTPGGRKYRWAEDSWDAANMPDDTTHGSAMPGGYSDFNAVLPRKFQEEYPDLDRLTDLQVLDGSGSTVWEGYLETAPQRSGDYVEVSPAAVGYQKMLEDDPSVNWLGCDPDLNAWVPAGAYRKATLGAFTATVTDPRVQPDDLGVPTGVPELQLPIGPGPWSGLQRSEAFYEAPGGERVAKVEYAGIGRSGASTQPSASFDFQIGVSDVNGWGGGADFSADLYNPSAPPGSISGTYTPATSRRWASLYWVSGGATATTGYEYIMAMTKLIVVGAHGLPLYPLDSPSNLSGLLASDVIPYLIRRSVPGLNVQDRNIQVTNYPIPQSLGVNTTVARLIDDHNKFHLFDWAVWEGREFYFNEPSAGPRNKRWKARIGPSQLEETGKDVRRIRNGCYVQFTGVDGTEYVVGPPGSGAAITSELLIDRDPLNEANLAGRKLYDMVEMRGVSEAAPAAVAGNMWLKMLKEVDRSGQALVSAYIQDDAGAWYPHTSVRAGDTIEFVDASDPSPRRITEVSHNRRSRESSVTLDAPKDGIEAILDRLQMSLVGTGL